MARLPFQRRGNALVPTTQDGRDAINTIEHGADVMIAIYRSRNMRQHNLFWALCTVVADHCGVTKEAIKEELCKATGHCHAIFFRDGSMEIRADSIACENMKAEVFEPFFQLAILKVCEWMGTAPDEVREHLLSMIESPPPLAPRERTPQQREPA